MHGALDVPGAAIYTDITTPDLLIRDLTDLDLQRLDQASRRLGLSRAEYVRRQLRQPARPPLTLADLQRTTELHADLLNADVMRDAWA